MHWCVYAFVYSFVRILGKVWALHQLSHLSSLGCGSPRYLTGRLRLTAKISIIFCRQPQTTCQVMGNIFLENLETHLVVYARAARRRPLNIWSHFSLIHDEIMKRTNAQMHKCTNAQKHRICAFVQKKHMYIFGGLILKTFLLWIQVNQVFGRSGRQFHWAPKIKHWDQKWQKIKKSKPKMNTAPRLENHVTMDCCLFWNCYCNKFSNVARQTFHRQGYRGRRGQWSDGRGPSGVARVRGLASARPRRDWQSPQPQGPRTPGVKRTVPWIQCDLQIWKSWILKFWNVEFLKLKFKILRCPEIRTWAALL